MNKKQQISAKALLEIANEIILSHESYIEGMKALSVEEKAEVLVFKGEYFLDNNGLPTNNTTIAFNIFKYLALVLSKQYTLINAND